LYWKFVCSSKTECFQRGLFCDTVKYVDEVKEVKKGNTLFIHNVDTDVLFGPFVTEGDGELKLEPDTRYGRYPTQVRVGWEVISLIRNASTRFDFLKHRTLKLSEREGNELLRVLILECVKIPDHLRTEIQRLGMEIHSLAHRIGEVICGKGRPADREVELDRLKGKFTAKMRGFMWAVRKLNRRMKILDLPSNR